MELFEVEKIVTKEKIIPSNTCKHCIFRLILDYGSSGSFSYCQKQKSNRTSIRLKKIKAKNPSCGLFQKGDQTRYVR